MKILKVLGIQPISIEYIPYVFAFEIDLADAFDQLDMKIIPCLVGLACRNNIQNGLLAVLDLALDQTRDQNHV